MDPDENLEESIELLQRLGLNEHEAKCYVALTRMDEATSRKLGEVADVPRTRVYDAARILEAQGLIESYPTNPKQYRAVPIEEGLDRIRSRYNARFAELQEALNTLAPVEPDDDTPRLQVWSIDGRQRVDERAIQLVKDASAEIVLAQGDESLPTESFIEALTEADRRLDVVIYAATAELRDRIRRTVPSTTTVVLGSERLHGMSATANRAGLGRILLIDQSASLISTSDPNTGEERAVFSQDPKSPIVSLICQLMVDDDVTTTAENQQ